MIVLFTDFGRDGPYIAQMTTQIMRRAPGVPVLDLSANVPAFDIRAGAYLLPAYIGEFPPDTVFVCVVDPGVGGQRLPVVLWADERWYVGPGNGLFTLIARRAQSYRVWLIDWMPEVLSSTFHGRDLFAPVAAGLARGSLRLGAEITDAAEAGVVCPDWPDELAQVIYLDGFGNAMTGLRAATLTAETRLAVGGATLLRARTFSDVAPGTAFWFENANGLAEIAVNGGHAGARLGLVPGSPVSVLDGTAGAGVQA
jgi:S-adenosylmethionine hydrolase